MLFIESAGCAGQISVISFTAILLRFKTAIDAILLIFSILFTLNFN